MKKIVLIILFILWRAITKRGVPVAYAKYLMSYDQLGFRILLSAAAIILFHKYLLQSFRRVKIVPLIKICLITSIAIILAIGLINLLLIGDGNPWVFKFPVEQRNALSVFHVIIVAPFFEEIFYRYILIYDGEKRWLRILTTIGSLLLFTLSHSANVNGNLLALFPFLIIGFFLTIAYLRKKNIWHSIFAHAVYNFTVIVMALLLGG